MAVAIVTGSGGLVGAEAVRMFLSRGLSVAGIDNNMRSAFFGPSASTQWQVDLLKRRSGYLHHEIDIRDRDSIEQLFSHYGKDIAVVVHCAAQPSHDWAARDPIADFTVNANGTLILLEATRVMAREAVFIFVSTNKVYGDRPNHLPLVELGTRYELSSDHEWHLHGIPESMPIDQTLHSVFGASKVAADIMVQEYGSYFKMRTACFRGGCLTGPGHSSAQLHGFLAYLIQCAATDTPYTIFGYKGKQVRDNIHVSDLVEAFWAFLQRPQVGSVYNMGGGRHSNCSVLEAIAMAESLTGRPMRYEYKEDSRVGDHVWWISDTRKFQSEYPDWSQRFDIKSLMADIHHGISARLAA
ncbi:MAG: NAD-dependent epimerase/dehydratase family protein [Burkholderiales bacterium]|nr:NAD-dependent epimerase/dehydratase family protein [Burkholderiales bacterium]